MVSMMRSSLVVLDGVMAITSSLVELHLMLPRSAVAVVAWLAVIPMAIMLDLTILEASSVVITIVTPIVSTGSQLVELLGSRWFEWFAHISNLPLA